MRKSFCGQECACVQGEQVDLCQRPSVSYLLVHSFIHQTLIGACLAHSVLRDGESRGTNSPILHTALCRPAPGCPLILTSSSPSQWAFSAPRSPVTYCSFRSQLSLQRREPQHRPQETPSHLFLCHLNRHLCTIATEHLSWSVFIFALY